ncbi:MAG TPA: cytochrome c peroxidase, partial [Polyangiaceae bacterium]|nr:cytochrome c peroxidase [Polyangiaceae bacterium]
MISLGCAGEGEEAPTTGGASDEASGDRRGTTGDPWRDVETKVNARSTSSFLADLGGVLFATPVPGGNGRSCATCHDPTKSFTITPAQAEARFQANPNDPLFRSIDADDFASDFTTVRTKALFRVTIPLPANVKLVDDPAATEVKLFRAVPSVFNVKLSAPYTSDGRAPTLDEQAKGALLEHSRPTNFVPPDVAFDLIALFQESKFSSAAVKSASGLLDAGQAPPPAGQDYDGPLTPLEQAGFETFK